MKVTGLNGREYNLDLKKYKRNHRANASFYHVQARDILHDIFLGYNILEEVKLPGSVEPVKKSVLYLDFFIPNANIAVEVHGQQHFTFVPYFHKSKAGFLKAKARDKAKAEWCNVNNIELVVLRYDSSQEHWRQKLELYR